MLAKIIVQSGHHNRENCLVSMPLPAGIPADCLCHLESADGQMLPCQITVDDNGAPLLLFQLSQQLNGAEVSYELHEGAIVKDTVAVCTGTEKGSYDILMNGKLFTTLHTDSQWAKPFMYPVLNSRGVQVTRAYPVIPDVYGETHDHPHQKSFWTAWGDVNGIDLWGEAGRFGTIVTTGVNVIENGPVRATVALTLDWLSTNGKRLMTEKRLISYACLGTYRAVDLSVTFIASDGDVLFGDTKEGGLCSIRVATSMDGTGAGTFVLADGSVGENEGWGKRAAWCDYYGPVPGGISGICIMDNPNNFRFPTYWHVRNYGLMTANPFGRSYFTGDKNNNGSMTLPAGTEKTFRYRVVFHEHSTADAHIAEKYQDYANPPKAVPVQD